MMVAGVNKRRYQPMRALAKLMLKVMASTSPQNVSRLDASTLRISSSHKNARSPFCKALDRSTVQKTKEAAEQGRCR
jgi:hypothetical protein